MNSEMITEIIKAVLTIVSILVTAYVVPWLKQKIGESKYNEIIDICQKAVCAAEKIYTADQWMLKKEYVFNLIKARAKAIGFTVTDEELNAIVEGIVFSVKGGE